MARAEPPVTPSRKGLHTGQINAQTATAREPCGVDAPICARVGGRLITRSGALVLVAVGRDTEATCLLARHPLAHTVPTPRPRRKAPVIAARHA